MTAGLHQNLEDLEAALTEAGFKAPAFGPMLERIRVFASRYAALERDLLGHVWLSVPAHLVAGEALSESDDQTEALARRERQRLALGRQETGDMMRLLDGEGLKVYRPEGPKDSHLDGVFLFDGEVGPLFVVNGRLSPLDADYVLARLYAYYLLDNDPYEIRFVHHRPGTEMGFSELRSHAFAGAFLIDGAALGEYAKAAGWGANEPWDRGRLEQLALYFEVSYRALIARLLGMGWVTADQVPDLIQATHDAANPELSPRETSAVPPRFTRLALESHARKHLSLEALAEALETDPDTAARLAARFRLEDAPDAADPPPAPESPEEA